MRFLVLLALAFLANAPQAQNFPAKPVRLIVPFPPGAATDIIGRLVAAKMQEMWGQTVLVENKPGAGTVVGTELVAKAAPDGYTLGTVITAHVINPSLRANLPYDTLKDLAAVTQVSMELLKSSAGIDIVQPVGSTPAELDAYIRTEIDKWARVVKVSGAKVD